MAYLAPPSLLMPPPLPEHHRSSSSDYYYFVLTMSIMAVMLVVSNIIAFTCCSHSYVAHNLERLVLNRRNRTVINRAQELVPLSKYKKAETYDTDCSVCLTGFTEGEEVRQLPKCKHSFHAPCIDMWLYSHSNCPVCRMAVEGLPPPQPSPRAPEVRRPLFTESPNLGQVVVTIV